METSKGLGATQWTRAKNGNTVIFQSVVSSSKLLLSVFNIFAALVIGVQYFKFKKILPQVIDHVTFSSSWLDNVCREGKI